MTKIAKMMKPTINDPPATNPPKPEITAPATSPTAAGELASAPKIKRVEAMLSTKRRRVVPSNNAGKDENSNALRWVMALISIKEAMAMLATSSKSRRAAGKGTTKTTSRPSTAAGSSKSRRAPKASPILRAV